MPLGKFLVILIVVSPNAVLASSETYPGHVAVLEAAQRKDAIALESIWREHFGSGDRAQDFVIALARYILDPEKYSADFINAVPTSQDEWIPLGDLDVERYAPYYFYTYSELSKLAKNGAPGAIKALLTVGTWMDGGYGEIVCNGLTESLAVQPATWLTELSRFDKPERQRISGCVGWYGCEKNAKRINDLVSANRQHAEESADEVRNSLQESCPNAL